MLDEQDKTVSAMEFVVDNKLIRVKAPNEASLTERQEVPFVKESRVVQGRIKSNLYESGIDAGLSPLQILDLAKIFESDVDFFSDLHPGDDFKVIMEDRRYLDGRRAAGRILRSRASKWKIKLSMRFTMKKTASAIITTGTASRCVVPFCARP
jgi:hypothetical protein